MNRRIIIAGTHSGVGKTTIALGLMAALRRRGLTVQPFKVGPDFIDPGHHTAVCGRHSRNLDTWMLTAETVQAIFANASSDADISIIEGVMGLYDGKSPTDMRGSTAHLARTLDAPVLLVVDASAMAASIAPLVKGFAEFDPKVRVAGVICNRVGSLGHYQILKDALTKHTNICPLGGIPVDNAITIPHRHLGLMTAHDFKGDRQEANIDNLAAILEQSLEIEQISDLSISRSVLCEHNFTTKCKHVSKSRVAIAHDPAFSFYYPENIEILQHAGAEISYFSPINDHSLPNATNLIYLGGGYPELYAHQLSQNTKLIQCIRRYHKQGGRIYAECGGLMYCCKELIDCNGKSFPMLGLLPARSRMQDRLAALGYVTWTANGNSLFGPTGTTLDGHEYHYSTMESNGDLETCAISHKGSSKRPEGYVTGNLLAGYAHLHFASNPEAAARLLSV